MIARIAEIPGYDQMTQIHLQFNSSNKLSQLKHTEVAWYDPVGDHLGHYDIDGVSPYHDIDKPGEGLKGSF